MKRAAQALTLLLLLATGCSLFVRPQAGDQPQDDQSEDVRAVGVTSIDSSKVAPQATRSPYWDKIRAGGPLVIGVNRRYPPFGVPGKDQPFVGFDPDLAEHLGQALGVPIKVVGITSQGSLDDLNSGRVDIVMAGLTRTVYRAAQVAFSAPYLTVSQGALIDRRYVEGSQGTDEERRRRSFESYADLATVTGLRIAVVRQTRPERLARSNFPNAKIQPYADLGECTAALAAGEVDALVHDAPYIRAWPLIHPSLAARFAPLLKPVTDEPIAIAIRQGDPEFLRFLDVYVHEVRQDGTVATLFRRHFLDGEWAQTANLPKDTEKGGAE